MKEIELSLLVAGKPEEKKNDYVKFGICCGSGFFCGYERRKQPETAYQVPKIEQSKRSCAIQ